MKILNVVGARPNFVKVAPIHRALSADPDFQSLLVHTGQHYDPSMSGIFFEQLDMPSPDYFLGIGHGSSTRQVASIMIEIEKIFRLEKPDLVLVVGDVNSTIGCALAAAKANIPVAHVEAGLRSGDRTMPEEINRIVTDSLSELLFVTERAALTNLLKENIPAEKIHFTGNVMIDSLVRQDLKLNDRTQCCGLPYFLVTMHRPANVDHEDGLRAMISLLRELSVLGKIIFPMHPRTLKNLECFGMKNELEQITNLILLPPQGYLEFLKLMAGAALVITDSGGVQEETTYLRIPCLTLRENTERPVTLEVGTNTLLNIRDEKAVLDRVHNILAGEYRKGQIPELWDGKASERIVSVLREKYINSYVCDKQAIGELNDKGH